MKNKLIAFAVMFVGNFIMQYFFSTRNNSIGEILFVSVGGAAIIALTFNYLNALVGYIISKIFNQKTH